MKNNYILSILILLISPSIINAQNITNNLTHRVSVSFFVNDIPVVIDSDIQICFLDELQDIIASFSDTTFNFDTSELDRAFAIKFINKKNILEFDSLKLNHFPLIQHIEFGVITPINKLQSLYKFRKKSSDLPISYDTAHPKILKYVFFSPQKREHFFIKDRKKVKQINYMTLGWDNADAEPGLGPWTWFKYILK